MGGERGAVNAERHSGVPHAGTVEVGGRPCVRATAVASSIRATDWAMRPWCSRDRRPWCGRNGISGFTALAMAAGRGHRPASVRPGLDAADTAAPRPPSRSNGPGHRRCNCRLGRSGSSAQTFDWVPLVTKTAASLFVARTPSPRGAARWDRRRTVVAGGASTSCFIAMVGRVTVSGGGRSPVQSDSLRVVRASCRLVHPRSLRWLPSGHGRSTRRTRRTSRRCRLDGQRHRSLIDELEAALHDLEDRSASRRRRTLSRANQAGVQPARPRGPWPESIHRRLRR